MSTTKFSVDPKHITVDIPVYNDMILEMLEQQQILDAKVIDNMNSNPDKHGVYIQPLTAIRVEASEGITHLGYKWWSMKNKRSVDLVFGEVIDVIHFTLSNMLANYCINNLNKTYREGYKEIKNLNSVYNLERLEQYEDRYQPELEDTIYNKNDDLVKLFEHIQLITFNKPSTHANMILLDTCFVIASEMGYDDKYVFKHYMGKCALNHLRANLGYGTTYIKIWADGREDNEHLMDIVNSLENIEDMNVDNILNLLENRYNEVNQ